jgi:hypothetical protein
MAEIAGSVLFDCSWATFSSRVMRFKRSATRTAIGASARVYVGTLVCAPIDAIVDLASAA